MKHVITNDSELRNWVYTAFDKYLDRQDSFFQKCFRHDFGNGNYDYNENFYDVADNVGGQIMETHISKGRPVSKSMVRQRIIGAANEHYDYFGRGAGVHFL